MKRITRNAHLLLYIYKFSKINEDWSKSRSVLWWCNEKHLVQTWFMFSCLATNACKIKIAITAITTPNRWRKAVCEIWLDFHNSHVIDWNSEDAKSVCAPSCEIFIQFGTVTAVHEWIAGVSCSRAWLHLWHDGEPHTPFHDLCSLHH